MIDETVERFWEEKEKEYKSVLLAVSTGAYLGGFPGLAGPVKGLIFIMENGVYFENFKTTAWLRGVFRDVFHVDDDFAKISLALKKKDIVDVFCFHGQKDKRRLSLRRRLGYFLGLTPRRLFIAYRYRRNDCTIAFACDEPPIALCAAFDGGRRAVPRLAAHGKNR